MKDVEMHDMGEMPKDIGPGIAEGAKPKEPSYPSFSVNAEKLPGLEGKKIDDICTITIKGRISGINADKFSGEPKTRYSIDVLEAGVAPYKKEVDLSNPEERGKRVQEIIDESDAGESESMSDDEEVEKRYPTPKTKKTA